MIVKNEEDVLARCLECIKNIVDEIIIVDTGSTDKTKEIALKYTNKVYDFNWVNDFAKARNYSFSKAKMEYIMWLDADDIITEKEQEKFLKLKNKMKKDVDIVMFKYNVGFDENNNVTLSYYRERIIKNNNGYKWEGQIHEVIVPYGNIVYEDIAIEHRKIHKSEPRRNLNIFLDMKEKGIKFDTRQQFYYARELYYNKLYDEAIKEFNNFIDNEDGWIENKISACIDLSKCYYYVNRRKEAFIALLKSFEYDIPRAEVCCEIGNYFLDCKNYNNAIYWYSIAASKTPDMEKGGFCLIDSYKFIPYMQLCICYYNLGNIKEAIKYNEKAGEVKPNNKNYLYNKKFFSKYE